MAQTDSKEFFPVPIECIPTQIFLLKEYFQRDVKRLEAGFPNNSGKGKPGIKNLTFHRDTIDELSISKYAELFKKAVNEWKINPVTAAVVLIQYPKRLSRSSYLIDSINEEMMSSISKSIC